MDYFNDCISLWKEVRKEVQSVTWLRGDEGREMGEGEGRGEMRGKGEGRWGKTVRGNVVS